MLLGSFDFFVFLLLLIFNYGIYKHKIIKKCNWKVYLVAFFLFGFILPFLSIDIEVSKVKQEFEVIDGFNLLYTLFRIPVWWLIGILEIVSIQYQMKSGAVLKEPPRKKHK